MLGMSSSSKSSSSGSYTSRASLLDFLTGGTGGSVHTYRGAAANQISPNMQQIMDTVLQRVRQTRENA